MKQSKPLSNTKIVLLSLGSIVAVIVLYLLLALILNLANATSDPTVVVLIVFLGLLFGPSLIAVIVVKLFLKKQR